MNASGSGRVSRAGGSPSIGAGIVSPAGVRVVVTSLPPRRSFRCRSKLLCDRIRAVGALVVVVAVQLSVAGLYLPPVLGRPPVGALPPQTIISLPVQTAVWLDLAEGALVVPVPFQRSVPGLYFPPVFKARVARVAPRPKRSFQCRSRLPCDSSSSEARWSCW